MNKSDKVCFTLLAGLAIAVVVGFMTIAELGVLIFLLTLFICEFVPEEDNK